MSALERIREKFKTPRLSTDKGDRSPSVSSVSSLQEQIQNPHGLDAELEQRIRIMARRWRYNETDLIEVLELAARDPYRWLLAVNLDERKFGTGEEWPRQ